MIVTLRVNRRDRAVPSIEAETPDGQLVFPLAFLQGPYSEPDDDPDGPGDPERVKLRLRAAEGL